MVLRPPIDRDPIDGRETSLPEFDSPAKLSFNRRRASDTKFFAPNEAKNRDGYYSLDVFHVPVPGSARGVTSG